jgi:hypothetical protein
MVGDWKRCAGTTETLLSSKQDFFTLSKIFSQSTTACAVCTTIPLALSIVAVHVDYLACSQTPGTPNDGDVRRQTALLRPLPC